MGNTLTIDRRVDPDLKLIRELQRPRTSDPLKIFGLARAAEQLADDVGVHWNSYPQSVRSALKVFAYCLVEPSAVSPRGVRRWFLRASAYWLLIKLIARGELPALAAFLSATLKLKDSVLDAVEREAAGYVPRMEAIVNDALAYQEQNKPIEEPSSVREWLSKL